MKSPEILMRMSIVILLQFLLTSFSFESLIAQERAGHLNIGWSTVSITPPKPVALAGQFNARISEGIMDPVTATVLVIESSDIKGSPEQAIMVSCDLVKIDNRLRDRVRELVKNDMPEIRAEKIFLNATHTHSAPYCSPHKSLKEIYGVDLPALSPAECLEFVSQRIREAVTAAWSSRKPGGISYGLGQAVLSHNRLLVSYSGGSVMYGKATDPEFSHVEGYEDHTVNLLFTWDTDRKLTGVLINVPAPSQVSEHILQISADYWHDVRTELGQKLGKDVHILPQCSAAGDQSPHILIGRKAEERMQSIMDMGKEGQGLRKQIARRITDAVISVYPYMKENIEWDPRLQHYSGTIDLSRRLMNMEDLNKALSEAQKWEPQYNELVKKINQDPTIKKDPRWYRDVTYAYSRMRRGTLVKERHELEKTNPKMPVEIHVIRIGDIALATNPYELYLDYGIRIKGRSPAVQTFIIQLAGEGTYLPPQRSVDGRSYGAEAASTNIGPEGGRELVEKTLEIINRLWED